MSGQHLDVPGKWQFYGDDAQKILDENDDPTSGLIKLQANRISVGSQYKVKDVTDRTAILLTVESMTIGDTTKIIETYLSPEQAELIGLWLIKMAKTYGKQ